MSVFEIMFSLLILQRVSELIIAKRNERWMISIGAMIHGKNHYPFIVALHILFLLSLWSEVTMFNHELSSIWIILLPLIVFSQVIRYWAIFSLGKYWNTKIIIVPNQIIESKGPYKFIRHPNYVAVALEIGLFPLLFHAYTTAIVFSFLNMLMMMIRIPIEEKALKNQTNYQKSFGIKSRFIPKRF